MIDTLAPMGDGDASLRLTDVTTTLETALTALRATKCDLDYRVGGTSAALLQGVHLPAGDIDLLVARREDVDTFAAALEAYPCLYPASWISETMQYFARYEINGVKLEISTVEWPTDSDGMENVGPGPWQHYVVVTCGSHRVPVIRLELRLATEILSPDNRTYNRLLRALRCLGERGFALLKGRWRTLQYIAVSPRKIGDIARAALVLTHFEHDYLPAIR